MLCVELTIHEVSGDSTMRGKFASANFMVIHGLAAMAKLHPNDETEVPSNIVRILESIVFLLLRYAACLRAFRLAEICMFSSRFAL